MGLSADTCRQVGITVKSTLKVKNMQCEGNTADRDQTRRSQNKVENSKDLDCATFDWAPLAAVFYFILLLKSSFQSLLLNYSLHILASGLCFLIVWPWPPLRIDCCHSAPLGNHNPSSAGLIHSMAHQYSKRTGPGTNTQDAPSDRLLRFLAFFRFFVAAGPPLPCVNRGMGSGRPMAANRQAGVHESPASSRGHSTACHNG